MTFWPWVYSGGHSPSTPRPTPRLWSNLLSDDISQLSSVHRSILALVYFIPGRREYLAKFFEKIGKVWEAISSKWGRNSKCCPRSVKQISSPVRRNKNNNWPQRATPSKTPCTGTTPQNFLKQSRIFGGAHVGVRLIVFGNKVAPVGTPKGKNFGGPVTP